MSSHQRDLSGHHRFLAAIAAAMTLGGCASLSPDAGFGNVQKAARERLGQDIQWARSDADRGGVKSRVKELLSRPLSADDAVQVALLDNPGLQATYSDLGIAEASLVQAGRLHNPGFTFSRVEKAGEGGVDIERKFLFDVMGLLTMPARTRLETRRFEQVQLQVTSEVMRVAAETRRAYFDLIGARQAVRYMEDAKEAADASAELARRMAAVGNWSKLDQSRQQVFYAETTAQLARTRQAAVSARERLTRAMGLWGEDIRFTLPERLPDLPQAPRELSDIESEALSQRLDVQAARKEVDGLAQSLGLTHATRFVDVLDASYLHNTATGEPRKTGYEIELSIPIFDFGDAKVARAEAIYMQGVNNLAQTAVNARSEVREAYAGYRTAFDLAKHYRDEVVPLHKKISEEDLLRYNGMLISVFELLADARSEMDSVNAYIQALRDFWLSETDLEMALKGGAGAVRDAARFHNATSNTKE
jgi:outer membrane protein TolC